MTAADPAFSVTADKNYWGGSTPAVEGMAVEVENYYLDEAKTILCNTSTGLADTTNVSATAEMLFEKVEEGDDYILYDMFVKASEDGKIIANLVSAEADITVTPPAGRKIGLEVIGGDYNVSTSENGKYLFNLKNGLETNVVVRTGEKVKIAQVKLTGYTHAIGNTAEKATLSVRNAFYNYEQMYDSLVKVQMPITDGDFDMYSKTVASKKLEVNITFPNAVSFNEEVYQNMLLTVTGGDLANAIEIKLDNSAEYVNGNAYKVVFENKLTKDIAYTVTVSGAGYRTARYTVTMNDNKVLNFWNNVKDAAEFVENGKDTSKKNVTFLAGDIVKDNIINIYDLSAVVSYFGEEGLSATNNAGYAKYDLNRDGKIDSKDVAYVLVSWNK